MKKHHWHAFQHEKLFEKQPLPHCQTYPYSVLFLAKQTNIKKRKKESPFLIASNPMVSFHPTNEKKKRKAMVFISNVCSL
jgi:hypothetical protein